MAVIQRWSLSQVWLYSLFQFLKFRYFLQKNILIPKTQTWTTKISYWKLFFLSFLFWWNILTNRKNMFSVFFSRNQIPTLKFFWKSVAKDCTETRTEQNLSNKSKKRNFQLPTSKDFFSWCIFKCNCETI